MEAFGGSMDTCGGGECAEADGYANAADGDDGGAGALQDCEDDSGPAQ